MRITDQQRSIIRSTVAETFGAGASVWLFGSRVDDTARGGDIDLYIEPVSGNAEELVDAKLRFLVTMHKVLGEQKIDVVIRRAGYEENLPIYQIAKQTGVKLT
jgi:predicted nucleotidyltransferase